MTAAWTAAWMMRAARVLGVAVLLSACTETNPDLGGADALGDAGPTPDMAGDAQASRDSGGRDGARPPIDAQPRLDRGPLDDGGRPVDAESRRDAETAEDAGPGSDAALETDQGPGADAGPEADQGPGMDAGPDAGPRVDSGPEADAGPGADAGPEPDAGPDIDAAPPGDTGPDPDAAPPSDAACVPAPEQCNGLDDDCDGRIDEGFELGAPCVSGLGACERVGVTRCGASGLGVVCGAVAGAPEAERCDGVDNDCDGQMDEDFALGEPCVAGLGECRREGTLRCAAGGDGSTCDAVAGVPGEERCDGRDYDCDGAIDEGFGVGDRCVVGQGICRSVGQRICREDGSNSTCNVRPGEPAAERCNGVDDDCDGRIDEDFEVGADCVAGIGVCAAEGTLVCAEDGAEAACDAEEGAPVDEVCDGVDNDCDGVVDEGVGGAEPCSAGIGACRRDGQTLCRVADDGGREIVCDADAGEPVAEICNNLDDDCDGRIDEGARNACGGCGAVPLETCNSRDDDCDGRVDEGLAGCGACQPSLELCNGRDDDCDGQVDEDLLAPCIVRIADPLQGRMGGGLGQVAAVSGDLDGDGHVDFMVSGVAANGESGEVRAISGRTGAELWDRVFPGQFGVSLAAGEFDGDGQPDLAVGQPVVPGSDRARVVILNARGLQTGLIERPRLGFGTAIGAGISDARWVLFGGEPASDGERGRMIEHRFLPEQGLGLQFLGAAGNRLAERLHVMPDLDGDQQSDVIATVRVNNGGRGTVLLTSAGVVSAVLTPPGEAQATFGEAVVLGRFLANGAYGFAFGTPGAGRIDAAGAGRVWLVNAQAVFVDSISTGVAQWGQGASLAVVLRVDRDSDLLAVGARRAGRVELYERVAGLYFPTTVAPGGVGPSFGWAVATSSRPAPDGTTRLVVGEPDAAGGRGRVHVFSVR